MVLTISAVIGFALTVSMFAIIGRIIIENKPCTKWFGIMTFILWILSLLIWSILSTEWIKVFAWAILVVIVYTIVAMIVSNVPTKVWIKHIWKKP